MGPLIFSFFVIAEMLPVSLKTALIHHVNGHGCPTLPSSFFTRGKPLLLPSPSLFIVKGCREKWGGLEWGLRIWTKAPEELAHASLVRRCFVFLCFVVVAVVFVFVLGFFWFCFWVFFENLGFIEHCYKLQGWV